jgi:predicted ATP-dependent protease
LPKENIADLDDLSDEERERITVHPVEMLSEVLSIALKRG